MRLPQPRCTLTPLIPAIAFAAFHFTLCLDAAIRRQGASDIIL